MATQNYAVLARRLVDVWGDVGGFAPTDLVGVSTEVMRVSFDGFGFGGLPQGASGPAGAGGDRYDVGSLPLTLAASSAEARFSSDGTVGVRWLLENGPPLGTEWEASYDASAAVGGEQANGSVWRLRGVDRDLGAVTAGPETADTFNVWGPITPADGSTSYIFEWLGARWLPDADPDAADDTLDTAWVRIQVRLPAGASEGIEWYGWAGPMRGEKVLMTRFVYPHIVLKGLSETRAAETARDAQARFRVLAPNTNFDFLPTVMQNFNLHYFVTNYKLAGQGVTIRAETKHPSSARTVGFWAAMNCNDLGAAYRQVFMVQARSAAGRLKAWTLQAIDDGTNLAIESSPAGIPEHSRMLSGLLETNPAGASYPGLRPHAKYGNSFAPSYAIETIAFQAQTTDWWYDCAERYRTAYIADGAPVLLGAGGDPRSDLVKKPGVLLATIYHPTGDTEGAWLDLIRTEAEIYNRLLGNSAHVQFTDGMRVTHFQTWTKESGGLVTGSSFNPISGPRPIYNDLPDLIDDLEDLGWLSVLYTWTPRENFNPEIYEGVDRWADPVTGIPVSFGKFFANISSPLYPQVVSRVLQSYRGSTGARGMYLDTLMGATPEAASAGVRTVEGGGHRNFYSAKANVITELRNRGFVVVTSEANEERSGLVDWAGDGYHWMDNHLALGDVKAMELLIGAGAPASYSDYPIETRNPVPPLWQCVHNRHLPSGRFWLSPTLEPMISSGSQGGGKGLTAPQMLDNLCLAFALSKATGHHEVLISLGFDVYYPLAELGPGNTLVSPSHDTTNVGTTFLTFLKDLWEAHREDHAGQFLIHGTMQRPLVVDHTSVNVARTSNPAAAFKNTEGWPFEGLFLRHGNWFIYSQTPLDNNPLTAGRTRFGNEAFEVVNAIHSVWKNDSGEVGIIIINWTGANANWIATMDPTLYGLPGASPLTVEKLALGGAPSTIGTPTGTFTIGSAGTPTVPTGTLGPRSITVIRVTS